MDSLFAFYKKNTGAVFVIALMVPVGIALLYGGIRSLWGNRRNKKERVTIYNLLLSMNANDVPVTNDEIVKATGIPRARVIDHCANHSNIKDAGKRQRSWRLRQEGEPEDE